MSMIGHNQPPHAGYILIFRQLLSHPVVGMMQPVKPADPKHPSASRLEAWLDLLMMAAYEDKTVKVNGHKYHLERGQNVCARAYLSERWNWSDKTVRAFLLKLEKHQMIDKSRAKKGQQANKVTICNYSQYQDGVLQEGPSRGQQKGQYRGQKEGHKNTQLSDCKQKRIDFSGGGSGPTKGPAKGPIEGPQYKQIKPNKPNNTLANSELEGYSALNGAANSILHGLARWIYLDSPEGRYEPDGKPIKPHFDMAEQLLKSNTDAYGAQAVKQAYAQMQGALLTKTDVRNHVKFFITVCGQEADKLRKATTRPRKVVRA